MTSCRGHFNSGKGFPVPNGQKAGWTPKAGTQFYRRNESVSLAWNLATIFSVGQPENWCHLKIKARQDGTVHRPLPPIYDTRCRLLQYSRYISDRLVHINGLLRFILRFLYTFSYNISDSYFMLFFKYFRARHRMYHHSF
jgi:hypothetical protein